jgi:hypothetical protein
VTLITSWNERFEEKHRRQREQSDVPVHQKQSMGFFRRDDADPGR